VKVSFGMISAVMLASCLWALGTSSVRAQSGTRQPAYSPQRPRTSAPASPQPGSTTRQPGSTTGQQPGSSPRNSAPNAPDTQRPPLAFNGYCAVCLIDGKQWSMGSPEYSVVFDSREYRFPTEAERNMFLANPDKYVPALNGNSVVAYVASGVQVAGDPRFGAMHRGRVYLFQNEQEKAEFLANPSSYAEVDLAHRGTNVVRFVDQGQSELGSSEFAARHQGFRYLFSSEQERDLFRRNPNRYTARTDGTR